MSWDSTQTSRRCGLAKRAQVRVPPPPWGRRRRAIALEEDTRAAGTDHTDHTDHTDNIAAVGK